MDRPLFPRLEPPYKVFWNWEITYKCNYKCSYCRNWRIKEETQNCELSRWFAIWEGIYDKYGSCLIRFSGGEPTVYPNFFILIACILENHSVDITTNLSFDIDAFMEKIKPGRISVSASFHPEYVDIQDFTKKVHLLLIKGYQSTITCVAYPPFLDKLYYYKQVSEQKGILFKISTFDGEYKKVSYPGGYTEKERLLLKSLAGDTNNIEQKNINTTWVNWRMEGYKKDTAGDKICRMGQMYALIHSDGNVTRCCTPKSPVIGNIIDKNFRLFDEPQPCEVEKCPCFKAMVVEEEEKWLPFWTIK